MSDDNKDLIVGLVMLAIALLVFASCNGRY